MPLDFLKRKGPETPEPSAAAAPVLEELAAQDYALKLHYHGKSSEGVRMQAGPKALDELPGMLQGLAISEVEVIQPLPVEYAEAQPVIQRPSEAMQWLSAHHELQPDRPPCPGRARVDRRHRPRLRHIRVRHAPR